MAELIILSLERDYYRELAKAARNDDPEAITTLSTLWQDYQNTEIQCFICGQVVDERPIFSIIMPDWKEPRTKLVAAPLDSTCRNLPQMLRHHRCLKILKWLASATNKKTKAGKKTGKQTHFIVQPQHNYPR